MDKLSFTIDMIQEHALGQISTEELTSAIQCDLVEAEIVSTYADVMQNLSEGVLNFDTQAFLCTLVKESEIDSNVFDVVAGAGLISEDVIGSVAATPSEALIESVSASYTEVDVRIVEAATYAVAGIIAESVGKSVAKGVGSAALGAAVGTGVAAGLKHMIGSEKYGNQLDRFASHLEPVKDKIHSLGATIADKYDAVGKSAPLHKLGNAMMDHSDTLAAGGTLAAAGALAGGTIYGAHKLIKHLKNKKAAGK